MRCAARTTKVVATTQPTLALEELQKNLFAVVIADQRMPVITGLELLEQAREIQPAATRILIAAVRAWTPSWTPSTMA